MKIINKIMTGIMMALIAMSAAIVGYAALGLGDQTSHSSTSGNSYVISTNTQWSDTSDDENERENDMSDGSDDNGQSNTQWNYSSTTTEPVYNLNSGVDLNSFVYNGKDVIEVNGNVPNFSEAEKKNITAYEYYSPLDSLGRCGVCYAVVCKETMPTEERGEIGDVKPTGWHTVKYNGLVDGNYLYNRCHLIAYQLTGENANTSNLITGTRHFNVDSMLTYENKIADYLNSDEGTNKHVLYRVTPFFAGNNPLATGVQLEAYSVEDSGNGVSFNVYCFNVQDGIGIDYATGDSWVITTTSNSSTNSNTNNSTNNSTNNNSSSNTSTDTTATAPKDATTETTFICNENTKKFHITSCDSVKDMKEENKKQVTSTVEKLKAEGYEPCANCLSTFK